MDAEDFHQVYVRRKGTNSGHIVRDFDLNIPFCSDSGHVVQDFDLNLPFCSDSCTPISEGSCELGDDGPLAPGLQLIPLVPVIHRRKRSHTNRQRRLHLLPFSPPPLKVCDQSRIVGTGSAVECHHSRPFVKPSLQQMPAAPVIHRRKRSHRTRRPLLNFQQSSPPPLQVCDQSGIVGSAVERHQSRPFITPSLKLKPVAPAIHRQKRSDMNCQARRQAQPPVPPPLLVCDRPRIVGSVVESHHSRPFVTPSLQSMPVAPTIHRRKRSHMNRQARRQPQPPIPPPLLVCDPPRIVGSAVETHHSRPFVTLSTATTTCSPPPSSADHESSAAAFAPGNERSGPTCLRIDVDELFTQPPGKKGKFISLTFNFYKE